MYYLINKKSRVSQHNYFFSNPKFEIAKNLFSLLEKDYVAKVYNIQMPQMKIHQVLFIPKTESNFPKILQGKGENLNEDDGDDIPYQNTAFHWNKKIYDPETHVKVRLMYELNLIIFFRINSDFKHYDFENGKHYGRF